MYYHHDRADLRGGAWLVGIGGLALLAIMLPIVHESASEQAPLITGAIAIALWLALVAVLGWQARIARGRADTITIDATGFVSQLFGRVDFADITSHAVGRDTKPWRWECNAPALRLTLADRRRLRFHLDARHYHEDLLDYVAFVDTVRARVQNAPSSAAHADVLGRARLFGDTPTEPVRPAAPAAAAPAEKTPSRDDRRARRAASNPSPSSVERVRRPRRQPATHDAQPDTRDDDTGTAAHRMSQANRRADQRFRQQMARHGKWAALAMVLLPLSYAIRTCDMSAIKPGPFDGMAEQAPQALENSRSLLQTAIAEKGPVYLWSNAQDQTIKPVLAPNVQARDIGIDTLDMMNTAGDLMSFVINDEAEGYRMGIQHDGTLALSSYSKISLRPVEGERTLFFFVLAPAGVDVESQTGHAMPDISWRVSYRNADDLPQRIEQADKPLPMSLITRWMQMTPPPRIMVAAARYHGMTDADFDTAVAQLTADFERRGIDTSGFETRRFDTGIVRAPEHDSSSAGDADTATDPQQREARDGHQ
ncbi:MAG: hypothetical protein CMN27_10270 [Salinisphaera sp.]|nr:hypothetical protein [Salinisphaera sp.]